MEMRSQAAAAAADGSNSNKSTPTPFHVDVRWHLPFHYWKLTCKNKKSWLMLICTLTVVTASLYVMLVPASSRFLSAPFQLPAQIHVFFGSILHSQPDETRRVEVVLQKAAMPKSKTVIITTLNAAWAKEGTMIDLFLESFQHGHGTRPLLRHLVIICVDNIAYQRCLAIHLHCIVITTHGANFSKEQLLLSEDYIKLMWRRIQFLQTILQLNYSFVFTDTDVLWLRNPFPLLEMDSKADFQIACDEYIGKPFDPRNHPNAGFTYARPNKRTKQFYGYWYKERKRGAHMADQEVLNAIKFEDSFASIGLKMRFLDTQYFGGFCALRSTDMTKAFTMHATCCKGLEAKLIDLRAILEKWKAWQQQNHTMTALAPQSKFDSSYNRSVDDMNPLFPAPLACPESWHKH